MSELNGNLGFRIQTMCRKKGYLDYADIALLFKTIDYIAGLEKEQARLQAQVKELAAKALEFLQDKKA